MCRETLLLSEGRGLVWCWVAALKYSRQVSLLNFVIRKLWLQTFVGSNKMTPVLDLNPIRCQPLKNAHGFDIVAKKAASKSFLIDCSQRNA